MTLQSFLRGNSKKRVILRLRTTLLNKARSEGLAGEDSARCGKSLKTKSRDGKSLTRLQRAKSTRFLGSRWRSRRLRKKLESSSPHLGNLFSDHGNFRLLHGNESKSDLGPSLMLTTAVRKKRSGAQRRMTKQEKRREPGVGNEHFSICKNRFPPLKRSKAS
jgi:hypothetical protein